MGFTWVEEIPLDVLDLLQGVQAGGGEVTGLLEHAIDHPDLGGQLAFDQILDQGPPDQGAAAQD